MIKFWLYIIFLIILMALGLAVGSANSVLVELDLLIVRLNVSVATVLVCGMGFGILVGLYISLLLTLKFWSRARSIRAEYNKYKRDNPPAPKTAPTTAVATLGDSEVKANS